MRTFYYFIPLLAIFVFVSCSERKDSKELKHNLLFSEIVDSTIMGRRLLVVKDSTSNNFIIDHNNLFVFLSTMSNLRDFYLQEYRDSISTMVKKDEFEKTSEFNNRKSTATKQLVKKYLEQCSSFIGYDLSNISPTRYDSYVIIGISMFTSILIDTSLFKYDADKQTMKIRTIKKIYNNDKTPNYIPIARIFKPKRKSYQITTNWESSYNRTNENKSEGYFYISLFGPSFIPEKAKIFKDLIQRGSVKVCIYFKFNPYLFEKYYQKVSQPEFKPVIDVYKVEFKDENNNDLLIWKTSIEKWTGWGKPVWNRTIYSIDKL